MAKTAVVETELDLLEDEETSEIEETTPLLYNGRFVTYSDMSQVELLAMIVNVREDIKDTVDLCVFDYSKDNPYIVRGVGMSPESANMSDRICFWI